MALYQRAVFRNFLIIFLICLLSACAPASEFNPDISVSIEADGDLRQLTLPAGSTVRDLVDLVGIQLGVIDRTDPSINSELFMDDAVRIIRVEERFETEQVVMPFESRTIQNESLPTGEQRLIQNGANGLEEVTYHVLIEDGELISRTRVSSSVITDPVEEIIMIGAQSPFSSVDITGRLAFLAAGNAWLLEGNSGARRAVVITGDLDGRVFEISPDGQWLLFTRQSATDINELWVASLDDESDFLLDLGVGNIIHYAGWVPGDADNQIAFSTVEPTVTAPGWQANNDLQFISFEASGNVNSARVVLPAREDSQYSWWGSSYAVTSDGSQFAFARPDAVGLVDTGSDDLEIVLSLTPYQTGSDWAWMPGLSWSPDGELIYTVDHAEQPDSAQQERSPIFDLVAFEVDSGDLSVVAESVGMFAQPVVAPDGSQIAFLRAFTPLQSDISAYELMVAAPDGGTLALFPPEGAPGLQPQRVAWSPDSESGPIIAFIYQGDLWVVNVLTGEANQLTGDGLVTAVSWR